MCRFIPSFQQFSHLDLELQMNKPNTPPEPKNVPSCEEINDENIFYKELLKKNLKRNKPRKSRSFNQLSMFQNSLQEIFLPNQKSLKQPRKISKTPFKVLDAPMLQDDYYLNVVDWSKDDSLAVGLGSSVFMWNFATNQINKVVEYHGQNFTSGVSWQKNGTLLTAGNL